MINIDAHQHFWNPARGDYGWMPKDNETLYRPYGPADLAAQLTQAGVDKTVLVQAAATIEETEYMLGIADATDFVGGVVGWINFEQPSHLHHLTRLADHPKFLGVRPMIQDISDVNWMLHDDIQWAYKALIDQGLRFDALGKPAHLANFLTLLKRYPDMKVVIDHCMKPVIAGSTLETFQYWADGMSRLANETGAYCKLSGLITEAGENWTIDDLRPYADHVINAFGPERVMWGSDWPVVRLCGEYSDWHAAAKFLTVNLGVKDQARIFGGSAAEFYNITA
ncbi:MAG: amidohydrolase family protein [Paracoccaceae bacterium]